MWLWRFLISGYFYLHQVTQNILLAHFQYPDSKNKNGYPVDTDIFPALLDTILWCVSVSILPWLASCLSVFSLSFGPILPGPVSCLFEMFLLVKSVPELMENDLHSSVKTFSAIFHHEMQLKSDLEKNPQLCSADYNIPFLMMSRG